LGQCIGHPALSACAFFGIVVRKGASMGKMGMPFLPETECARIFTVYLWVFSAAGRQTGLLSDHAADPFGAGNVKTDRF